MAQLVKILCFLGMLVSQQAFAQSIADIRKQKENSEKEINYLNQLLEGTKGDKSVSMGKLNILQRKIVESKKLISSFNDELKYLQDRISVNESRIGELQSEKNSMLDLYAKLVYNTWKKRNKTNKLMFICSSSDFNQAYNRFKYFQQIQEYSKRQLELIEQVNDSLDLKNEELGKLIAQKNQALNTIGQKNRDLESEQSKENRYVSELQKREKELKRKLDIEARNRQKLTSKLNELIARQAKKSGGTSTSAKLTPEEKLISNDFEKNRGRLPWPVVEGFISERFGITKHPTMRRVEISNDGVSITTSKGADVRSVFKGKVMGVIYMGGTYSNVVIVQHGNYITSYANLLVVNVKEGENVDTKQVIGKIAYDEEDGSVLNFQIWRNSEKLDPELWLAK